MKGDDVTQYDELKECDVKHVTCEVKNQQVDVTLEAMLEEVDVTHVTLKSVNQEGDVTHVSSSHKSDIAQEGSRDKSVSSETHAGGKKSGRSLMKVLSDAQRNLTVKSKSNVKSTPVKSRSRSNNTPSRRKPSVAAKTGNASIENRNQDIRIFLAGRPDQLPLRGKAKGKVQINFENQEFQE